jgi:hypothetical protein
MTLAALRALNLITVAAHQFFELAATVIALVFKNRHLRCSLLSGSYSRSAIAILSIHARTSDCGAAKSFTRIENASRPCVLLSA